jgi:mRNA-degrading endonuclease RelE of RelBE toxin-antitoxin system
LRARPRGNYGAFRDTFASERAACQDLAREARPVDAKELREQSGFYRLRLDGWRIIYRVDDENQAVRIIRVRLKTGPETYENLE